MQTGNDINDYTAFEATVRRIASLRSVRTMVRRNTLLIERERQEHARECKLQVKEKKVLSERKSRKPISVRTKCVQFERAFRDRCQYRLDEHRYKPIALFLVGSCADFNGS